MEERTDRFTAIEDRFAGYEVYDQAGEKIGKVDDLFVDESDQPEYVGVKMGFLGMSSTLIPWQLVTLDEGSGRLTAATDKDTAKNGPAFDDDREITPEFEQQVYSYYGLQRSSEGSGSSYGSYYSDDTDAGTVGPGMSMGDTETGEFREHAVTDEGVNQSRGDDLEDEDELRVQRSEEELRAGTREREAGALNVRKRVVTERQQMEVPTRREQVTVERVPVAGEVAAEAEIGEDEVVIPVSEEEVVVEKRPVAKEEVRIRKDVVEETEVVEEDVRREEIDIDDEGIRRTP